MVSGQIQIKVTGLFAQVPGGVPILWHDTLMNSGPLLIELDETGSEGGNTGVLDYDWREVKVEFHVRVRFPELADLLESLGASSELAQPVRAVLRSEGKIQDDHSFALSGASTLRPHSILVDEETSACVLPGT
jgi:hypothetical protein